MIESSGNDAETIRKASAQLHLTTESFLNAGRVHDVLRLAASNVEIFEGLALSDNANADDLAHYARLQLQLVTAMKLSQHASQASHHAEVAHSCALRAYEKVSTLEHRQLVLAAEVESAADADEFSQLRRTIRSLVKKHPRHEGLMATFARVLLLEAKQASTSDAIELRKKRSILLDDLCEIAADPRHYEMQKVKNEVFLAVKLHGVGDDATAGQLLDKATTTFRQATKRAPGVAQHRIDLAETLVLRGNMEWERGDHESSIASHKQAISLFEDVVLQDPEANVMLRRSGQINGLLAQRHQQVLEKPRLALAHYEAALNAYRRLFALPPTHYDDNGISEMTQLLSAAADLYEELGEHSKSELLRSAADNYK